MAGLAGWLLWGAAHCWLGSPALPHQPTANLLAGSPNTLTPSCPARPPPPPLPCPLPVDLLINERQVVTREVRGGYYHPSAYLVSKLTLDASELSAWFALFALV